MADKLLSEDNASTWAAGVLHPVPHQYAAPGEGNHMIHRSSHRAVHCLSGVTPLLCLVILICLAGINVAAVVGDQVELKATHQAGVPLHQQPRGTNDFQRVPDGTRGTVLEVAPNGRWVKLSLPDGRTGWVTSRYADRPATSPSTEISPAEKKPQRIEEGIVAPETPKGTKFPGQPYGPEAEAYLKRLVEGKRVTVEIYGVDRYKRLLSTIFLDGKDINLAMLEAGLAEVYRGPESGNPYKPQYQAAEKVTRSAKKGMWVLGDTYESPRTYRKRVGIS
jgi:endonuclease YncB( thermonuclease family)